MLGFVLVATACTEKTDEEKGNDEMSFESEQFGELFLKGDFERIYGQTSGAFQEAVSFGEFESLGIQWNEGVNEYEQIKSLSFQGLDESLWLSDTKDKGIRVYFDEESTIQGLQVLPITNEISDAEFATKNTYQYPINEEMFVFWGGHNELVNYHYALESQRYAYDLVQVEDRFTYEGSGTENENYFVFGKEVLAPLEGIVVSIENSIYDNQPNIEMNAEQPLGNYVIIKHQHDEYSVLAHFKEGSIVVQEGDEVESGQLLGLVGNSGNSSEPHIHYHVSNDESGLAGQSLNIQFVAEQQVERGDQITGF